MGSEFFFAIQILRKEHAYLQERKDVYEMRKDNFNIRQVNIKIAGLEKAMQLLKELAH